MAGHSSYSKDSSLYLYYNCPNCNSYISETKLLDKIRFDLDDIYENYSFLLDIENSSILDTNDLRFIQDGSVFRRKIKPYDNSFSFSFDHLNEEEQRTYIDSLIEKVYLKQASTGFQIEHIEYKNHQINLINILKESNQIDEIVGKYHNCVSLSEMKSLEFEGYLNELIDIVENFAEIDIIGLKEYDESLLNDNKLLKVVKIKAEKKIFRADYKYIFMRT